MRTLKPLPPLPNHVLAKQGLGAWVEQVNQKAISKPPKKKAKYTPRSVSGYEQARAQAEEFAKSGTWGDAEPRHLVGLYALLHEQVYGVPPEELKDAWKTAVGAAKHMLEKEFAGDMRALIEFIRWVWKKERRREDMRKANPGDGGFRIGWRYQFKNKTLLTDYRVELARAVEAATPKGKR